VIVVALTRLPADTPKNTMDTKMTTTTVPLQQKSELTGLQKGIDNSGRVKKLNEN
jgi:hypothetical protein